MALCFTILLVLSFALNSTLSLEILRNAAAGTIELYYWNPESLREDGSPCDFIVFERPCDVFFEICIGTQSGDCSIMNAQTETYMKRFKINLAGQSAIPLVIKHPTPESLSIEVAVYDFDKLSSPDLIGKYEVEVPVTTKEYFSTISANAKNESKRGPRVDLRLKLKCSENFFGLRCEKYCKSDGLSYYCSSSGDRICLEGFSGEFCNLTDICAREPCAYGATCVPKLLGRICICNGGHYPECYPLTDPCRFSPCRNGGVCDRSSTNPLGFVCTCPKYYTGVYCEQRLSLCALIEADQRTALHIASKMALRGKEENGSFGISSTASGVCLNGGVCVDHPTKFTFFCSCPKGWTGSRCETEVVKPQNLGLIVGLTCVAFCVIIAVGIIIYACKRRKWKRRVNALHERNAFVYKAALRSARLSVDHPSNETYDIIAKPSVSASSYDPIMPCLGDSLSIHHPQTVEVDDEEKPPLPLRPPLVMAKSPLSITVPLTTEKPKERR
ncbi:Delta-like protein 4 [Taenia crassiceps]|uniref:Delta-like protein n=1 Tax=Taenia crassiceps TaxID=6207 RepID=A0ABR4QSQ1_9CEST